MLSFSNIWPLRGGTPTLEAIIHSNFAGILTQNTPIVGRYFTISSNGHWISKNANHVIGPLYVGDL